MAAVSVPRHHSDFVFGVAAQPYTSEPKSVTSAPGIAINPSIIDFSSGICTSVLPLSVPLGDQNVLRLDISVERL